MKKLVTISATAMMGFTALGGFQGMAQAMENSSIGLASTFAQHVLGDTVHADTVSFPTNVIRINLGDGRWLFNLDNKLGGNYDNLLNYIKDGYLLHSDGSRVEKENLIGASFDAGDKLILCFENAATNEPLNDGVSKYQGISNFEKGKYYEFSFNDDGTVTGAEKVVSFPANVIRINLGDGRYLFNVDGKFDGNYNNLLNYIKDGYLLHSDGSRVEKENLIGASFGAGDKLILCFENAATNEPLNDGVSKYQGISNFENSRYYEFSFNNDGTVTGAEKVIEQQGQTDVVFEHTETPGEPGWYGVVPASITFTDNNKDQALDATVKIVNADDQTTDYTGSKSVAVKVKSTNGFDLKDGEKEAVEYSLTKKDATAVTKDNNEQDLGIVKKGDVSIPSKATLKGEAKESGKFVDTLNYHFVEQ